MCSFLNWEKKVKNMLIYIYRYFALQFGVNQKKGESQKIKYLSRHHTTYLENQIVVEIYKLNS